MTTIELQHREPLEMVAEPMVLHDRAYRRRVLAEARDRVTLAMHELLEAIRIAEQRYQDLAGLLETQDRRAAGAEYRLRAEGYLP